MSTGAGTRSTAVLLGCVLALCASPSFSISQVTIVDEPVFRSYGMANGLSHGSILTMIQSQSGFLWMGTQDGLNRFDGITFKAYKHDPNDPSSLSDDFIEALVEAPNGSIWVGTNRGGLNRFDPTSGRAERYELFDLGPWAASAEGVQVQGRPGRTIHAIAVGEDGDLLLASDLGLVRFDVGSASYMLLEDFVPEADGARWQICGREGGGALVALPTNSVDPSSPSSRWSIIELDENSFTPLTSFEETIGVLRCPSGSREGYAVTVDGNVHAFDERTGLARTLSRISSPSGQAARVEDVLDGPDGNLWVATLEGLYVTDRSGNVRRVGADPSRGLPDALVLSLLVDRTGVFWIGTWNGLASVHPLAFTMRRVPVTRGGTPGLAGNGVIAIEAARAGGLWLGTSLGGVQLLRTDNLNAGGFVVERPPNVAVLANARIMDLSTDSDGVLWIAALTDGVFRLDARSGRLERVPIRTPPGGRVRPDVYSVFVDRRGEVWAGTRRLGLLRLGNGGEELQLFTGPDSLWDFAAEWVWPITEDISGNLWVGAYSGGLYRIAPDRRGIRLYPASAAGLDRILTVHVDSRGLVWTGSEGQGMSRLDPITGVVRLYTTSDGLPHDNVEAITEDGSGDLWVSTNDGIARFDVEREEFRVYRESAGLAGNRFFANSVYRASSGEIYFGGEAGLTILDPSRMVPGEDGPLAALSAFRLNGSEVSLERALAPGGLDLEPGENFFAFEFSSMDFRDAADSRYRYRLEGLDDDWIDSGTRGVANYTSVPPGSYTFRVAVRNGDGVWNEEAIAIPVRVQAPYHQTLWFRSLVLLSLMGLLTAVYAYRLRELRRRQEFRLSIASRMHHDIGANLSTIYVRAGMLARAAGLDTKLEKHVSLISELARESALRVRETVWVVNTSHDTLPKLVGKLRDTADMMLTGHVAVRFAEPSELPDRRIGMELRQEVYLAFKEALQNILKHAQATSVDIELGYRHPDLTVRVRDNGIGCDSARLSTGNGVGLMRDRIAKHGGEVLFSASPGEGTTVLLRVRVR